jgi:hypothetical protein
MKFAFHVFMADPEIIGNPCILEKPTSLSRKLFTHPHGAPASPSARVWAGWSSPQSCGTLCSHVLGCDLALWALQGTRARAEARHRDAVPSLGGLGDPSAAEEAWRRAVPH